MNVKDFGAVGDGVADDTDAIQKAVNASREPGKSPSVNIRRHRPHGEDERQGGFTIPLRPEIIFPEGVYRITRPIVFINYAHVRGIGKSVIQQTNPDQDIFYFCVTAANFRVQSTHFTVRGLRFEGGKTQLRFWPENVNATLISIDRCEFADSGDYAVVCRMYATPEWPVERIMKDRNVWLQKPHILYWAPYLVEWKDGMPYLHPNKVKQGPPTADSTLLRMANCRFDRCMGVADVSPDMTFIRDTEVIANPQTDGAIFDLYGSPHLYRVKGVASPAAGKNPYWIRGGSLLSVRECEFDATTDKGIDFIRDWDEDWKTGGKYDPWDFIIVENTRVKVAGSPSNALVWLGKRRQTNVISLLDVTETSGKPVRAIKWEASEELVHLSDFRSTLDNVSPKVLHKILLARNSSNIDETLPPPAKALCEKPAPADLLKKIIVPELSWKSGDLRSKVHTTINAAEHGVDDDPETDDTPAIQKLFDEAAEKGICEVVFPAGVYLITEPIRLPSEVFVRGAGLAAFQQVSLEKDIFHAENPKLLGFRNVLLKSGRYGVDITPEKAAEARIAFTDCWFTDQAVGVRCMTVGKENNAEILIEGGYIDSTQAVVSNAKSQIDAVWVFNGRNLENQGFFENHGSMRLQAVLGVPSRYPGNVMLENPRWVDNFGRFQSLDTRYGGEGGGFCNVYNRSSEGTVYINGGVSRSNNSAAKKCLLYLEKTPKAAVLQTISTSPWVTGRYDGFSITLDPEGRRKNAKVFITGLTTPQSAD